MAMMPATTVGRRTALPVNLIGHGPLHSNTQRQIAVQWVLILISILTNVTNDNMPSKHLLKTDPLVYKDHAINATLNGYHVPLLLQQSSAS